MNQKVICNRAHKCDERKNECGHCVPHEVEVFSTRKDNGHSFKCTDEDDCMEYMVRCVPVGIDFEIEEMFSL